MGSKITNLQFWPSQKIALIKDDNGALNFHNVGPGLNQSASPISVDKAISTKVDEVQTINKYFK